MRGLKGESPAEGEAALGGMTQASSCSGPTRTAAGFVAGGAAIRPNGTGARDRSVGGGARRWVVTETAGPPDSGRNNKGENTSGGSYRTHPHAHAGARRMLGRGGDDEPSGARGAFDLPRPRNPAAFSARRS